jgi:hypothetical protein
MGLTNSRLVKVQGDLARVTEDRILNENKLIELDQLVRQLLSVNESLVNQLAGKDRSLITNHGVKKTVKKKPAQVNRVALPHAALTSTQSYDAKHRNVEFDSLAYVSSKHLKDLHEMYSSLAKNILKKNKTKSVLKSDSVKKSKIDKKKTRMGKRNMNKATLGDEKFSTSLQQNQSGSFKVRVPSVGGSAGSSSRYQSTLSNSSKFDTQSNHSMYSSEVRDDLRSVVSGESSLF